MEVFQAAPLYGMTEKLQRRQAFRKLFPGIQIILQAYGKNGSAKLWQKMWRKSWEHQPPGILTQEQPASSALCLGAEVISI